MDDAQIWSPPPEVDAESERRLRQRVKASVDRVYWSGYTTSLAAMIVTGAISPFVDRTFLLTSWLLILYGVGVFALPIGFFSGWFSHKCCAGTTIAESFVAMAVAGIAVFSIFGWGLVMSSY